MREELRPLKDKHNEHRMKTEREDSGEPQDAPTSVTTTTSAPLPKPNIQLATCKCLCGIPIQLRYFALCSLVVQTTSAVILTRYSKLVVEPGQLPYHSTTLVVMSELSKLILSLVLVFLMDDDHQWPADAGPQNFSQRFKFWKRTIHEENFVTPLNTLKLIVPAMLYTLQNNLIYVALANLEATTFQVGYQMKVITTAVLSVLMLNRHLSAMKWLALFLLTAGIVMTQLEGGKTQTDEGPPQNFALGLISVIICGCSSAFAGVYFEKIVKGSNPSVWVRNAQLAFFSTILGLMGVAYNDGFRINFFQGYNTMIWTIIAVQAAGGLIIATVIKYADNILKGFATAMSIICCGLTSKMLFNFEPSLLFLGGSIVVIVATMLYSKPDPPRTKK